MNLPDNLPPLPPVPPGFDRWEYRGIGWETEEKLPTLRCEKDIQLAEARTAFREIVRDFNFCADESPNSFCSRACADVAKQALARIDANAGAEVPR